MGRTQKYIRGGADKSLAQPGREQATATKLGIYSTYSPRSSIHFLARCSKKIQKCPPNQISAAAMISASEEKWRPFNSFQVQGTGGRPTGPDPENRWVIKTLETHVGQFFSALQVPGEPGHCRARTGPPFGDLTPEGFLQNVLQLHHQR